jgi:hypothetical protein
MNFLAKADAKTRSLTAAPGQTKARVNGWMTWTAAHIHTEPKFAEPDAQDNHHQQLGEFTSTGGETRGMNDVWFAVTAWNTLDLRPAASVSAEIKALPDLVGSGNLASLHQAMARDETGELMALVSQCAAVSIGNRDGLLQNTLCHWARVCEFEFTRN